VIESGRLPVEGGELAYDVEGDGLPLVLVHAGICDGRMWDDVWPELARRYRVARFDMRGYGNSSVTAAPYAPHDDVMAVLDHLGFDRAVLCGVSFGGAVELDVALAAPGRVRALVLVCCSARGMKPPAELRALMDEADEIGEQGDFDTAVELELRIWLDGVGRRNPVDPAIRERVREMSRRGWERALEGAESRALDPPASGRLGKIRVPTLVVAGEHDQPWITDSCRTIAEAIPGARFELVRDVAHLPPLERPAAFVALLTGFMDDL
jgi:3-oxoadipate enol-lactonase